jgi:hypothetical protein
MFVFFSLTYIRLAIIPFLDDVSLLQKQVILTKEFSQERPHLDKHQKDHLVNLNKSFCTYPA